MSASELYAIIAAAGFPHLAFLLTPFEPRDPIDEILAREKVWLTRLVKTRRNAKGTEARVYDEAFIIHTTLFMSPENYEKNELYEAKHVLDKEVESLIELVETEFKNERFTGLFDRYIDILASLEGYFEAVLFEGNDPHRLCFPPSKLIEWAEVGAGKLKKTPDGSLQLSVRVRSSHKLPIDLKEVLQQQLEWSFSETLKEVAKLLAAARYAEVGGIILAKYV
jgi:hypothetical protein